MKKWKITALNIGTLDFEKSIATYLKDCGVKMKVNNIMFLLEEMGGSRKVIVDTGFESVERTMAVHGQQALRMRQDCLELAMDLREEKTDAPVIEVVNLRLGGRATRSVRGHP